MPDWWHYTGAAGPVAAAALVTALTEGKAGLEGLLAQYSPRRAPAPWLLFAVFPLLVVLGAYLLASRRVDGAWPSYSQLATTDDLPNVGLPQC